MILHIHTEFDIGDICRYTAHDYCSKVKKVTINKQKILKYLYAKINKNKIIS